MNRVDSEDFIERRRGACLSEAQIDDIAERAADKASERAADRAIEKLTQHVYNEIGRTVLQKSLWIVGACTLGIYAWLQSKGLLNRP